MEDRKTVNDSILIIGHPASGKTTFIAQFLTRIKKRKSDVKLTQIPKDISAITDAVKRLSMGEEPLTTSASENVELTLPIEVDGKRIDLVCPDYGGEQVNDITELMELNKSWMSLLNDSDRWMFFIRPHEIMHEYDLSKNSYEEMDISQGTDLVNAGLSAQSKFIELLQTLLYAKNKGIKHSIKTPTLLIVQTCWDEMRTERKPLEVLQNKLPMLLHFVETVWDKDFFDVLGLSAQEFPLDTDEAKTKYQDELPENFGYIVDQDGKRDKDITKLVKVFLPS